MVAALILPALVQTFGSQAIPITCNDRRLHRDVKDAIQGLVESKGFSHFRMVEGDGACYYRAVLLGAILASHGVASNPRRASMLNHLDAMAEAVSGA